MNKKIRFLIHSAAIAALYVIVTVFSAVFGLSGSVIQIRLSEALTILPIFTPAAIPGLFIGCFLGNIITGCMIWDVIFGSLATLLGAVGTFFIYRTVKKEQAASVLCVIPPIVVNTAVIPFILSYVYGFEGSLPFFFLTVFAGEFISAGILGRLLYSILKKYRKEIFE